MTAKHPGFAPTLSLVSLLVSRDAAPSGPCTAALILGCVLGILAPSLWAQNITVVPAITTVAGNGTQGYSGDGGPAISAQLTPPQGVAVDRTGNLYIADALNNRVRKVDTSGIITTVAGSGVDGYSGDNGPAISAELSEPHGVALDRAGNLYVADAGSGHIRKVDSNGIITTVAGNGTLGYTGDGGPAASAELGFLFGLAVDHAGNLYIADRDNNRVRKVDTSGIITTVAGNGVGGYSGDNGPAISAELNEPFGVALDSAGNLYVADAGNGCIRKVDSNGIITTVAGNGTAGYTGDGGPATSAELSGPVGVAIDSAGNLYIADSNNSRIRKVDTGGTITTVAGDGVIGYSGDKGPATSTALFGPTGVALDSAGNLYVADAENDRIREVVSNPLNFGQVHLGVSNTQSVFLSINTELELNSVQASGDYSVLTNSCPMNAAISANSFCNLQVQFTPTKPGQRWFALQSNYAVDCAHCGQLIPQLASFGLEGTGVGSALAFTPGMIGTVAGNGTQGYNGDNIAAVGAELSLPIDVALDSAGNLYIADYQRIRKVDTSGIIITVAGNGTYGYGGDGGPATSAELFDPLGLAIDSAGNLYIADFVNNRIRKVDTSGIITTVAGNGTQGYSGDGGPATSAELFEPRGVAIDSAGNLYIADSNNNRIRKVDTSGIITTVVGNGTEGYSGDGGPATSAELFDPVGLAIDSVGNLYFSDIGNHRIRKVDTSGIITTVAGNGTQGYSGDGGPATSAELSEPNGVAIDSGGNLYIGDVNINRIRKVDTSGIITTVAGNGTQGYSGDGGPATSAELFDPLGLAIDSAGNLYVADINNARIRKVDVTTSVLEFGPLNVGQTSAAQSVAVSNVGNAPLNFTSVAASPNFQAQTVGNDCVVGTPLAVGATCNVGVAFAPTTTGSPLTGALIATDDAFNSPQVVSLTGTANPALPVVGLSPSSLPFAARLVGTTSTVQTSTLTNVGNVPLSITSILASGDFALVTTGTSCPYAGGTVNASASCTIDLKFGPSATGTRNGKVTIMDNAADSPEDVTLSGTGFMNITWTPTSLGDDGSIGTLRYAIANANPGDTISVSQTGTITLALGQLEINKDLTINGPGATSLAISGNNSSRVFQIDSGVTATISGLKVQSGAGGIDGREILNYGTLSLTDCAVSADTFNSNNAVGNGGGLSNQGTATITRCTFTGNPDFGVAGNGGGINNTGSLSVVASTFSNFNVSGGGAGIFNAGTATVTNSTFSEGGGAVFNFNGATLTMINSTLSGSLPGPAIYNLNSATTLKNTLMANSQGGNCVVNGGFIISKGFNLSDDASCSAFLTQTGDVNNTPARLDPGGLKDNGGTTQTVALVFGSPAIDAIPLSPVNYCTDADGNAITIDQRGVARPQGAACDIGAVERLPGTSTTVTLASSANPSNPSQAVTLTATVAPSSGAGAPTGTVTFNDGAATLGTAPLSANGEATFTAASLGVGTHSITASYGGDIQFNGSASAAVSQVVNKLPTTTGVVSSLNPSIFNQLVTFTASVSSGGGSPTGTVAFYDGATALGTVGLTGNQAVYSTSTLGVGVHPITATYSGDETYASSTSGTLLESIVVAPTITSASSATFRVGSAGAFSVMATGTPAPTFSLTGALPGGVAFNPTTGLLSGTPIAGSNGTYNLTVTAANGVAPNALQNFTLNVIALQSINVTPANSSLQNGLTLQLSAIGTYVDTSVRDITGSVAWTSSRTSVASISASGLATGIAQGTTTIRATEGTISGATSLTVAPPALVSISVTPANPSVLTGANTQFVATGTYSDASTKTVTTSVIWSSSNTSVATITGGGLATGAGTGTTTITASVGSISSTTVLTVQPTLVSITITPASPSVSVGLTLQLTATGNYSDGSMQDLSSSVTWTSNKAGVATISTSGLATGFAKGNATIRVKLGGITNTTTLSVTP